jgi:hypothetical protein
VLADKPVAEIKPEKVGVARSRKGIKIVSRMPAPCAQRSAGDLQFPDATAAPVPDGAARNPGGTSHLAVV